MCPYWNLTRWRIIIKAVRIFLLLVKWVVLRMRIRKNVQTLAVQRGRALGAAPGSRGPAARSRLPSQHWPQESRFVIVTASASSLPRTQRGTSPKRGADSGPFLPGDPEGRGGRKDVVKTGQLHGRPRPERLWASLLPAAGTQLARGQFREPRGGSVSLIFCLLLRSFSFSSTRSCSLPSVIKGKGNNNEPRLQRSTPCSSVSWTNKMPDDAESFKAQLPLWDLYLEATSLRRADFLLIVAWFLCKGKKAGPLWSWEKDDTLNLSGLMTVPFPGVLRWVHTLGRVGEETTSLCVSPLHSTSGPRGVGFPTPSNSAMPAGQPTV